MVKALFRTILALFMIGAGIGHFRTPEPFVRIVPPFLPAKEALVYISGFFEILIGVGLCIPKLRRIAAWGLVALLVAVFPANIYMAVAKIPFGELPTPDWALWLRLPLQFLLMAWAWTYTRREQ